jgi:RNA polymerase sigma factor (sigma-70 family)
MSLFRIVSEDEEIISSLREGGAGRKKGEEKLFSSFYYFIREGIRKYHIPEQEAFDAYSDTILAAIENISTGQFEERSSLKTYLYQIFQRKCVDVLRKKTTNKSKVHHTMDLSPQLALLSDPAHSAVQALIEKTDWGLLRRKLGELGDRCRQILLSFAEGESDQQISLALGYKTADVVKTSRLRCLEKLRQLYRGENNREEIK